MINVNNVALVGRLTKDIDLRKTQNNLSVCKFTLAVNRPKRKDHDEETDFIQCVAWNYSAEFLANYATKGTIVSVVGKIRTSSYESRQDGAKMYVTEVHADDVQIISQQNSTKPVVAKTPVEIPDTNIIIEDKDLPFY